MGRKRRTLGSVLKAKAGLAAIRGDKTTPLLTSEFEVYTSEAPA
jgi:hypothetical protein